MAAVYLQSSHVDPAMWLKLNDMRKKGVACDIELVADDSETRYPAHLCILAASSAFLKQQLHGLENISRNTLLRMSGFSSPVLEAVLEFIYTGSLTWLGGSINEVERAARVLQVTELPQLCKKMIARQRIIPKHDSLYMLQDSMWHRKLQDVLNVFRLEKQYCNARLQVNEFNTYHAHACLLIAASSYFETYIPVQKIEEGSIIFLQLKELAITTAAMQTVLEYIYTGNFSCASHFLGAIADFASILKLDRLIEILNNFENQATLAQGFLESNDTTEEIAMDTEENLEAVSLEETPIAPSDIATAAGDVPVSTAGGDVHVSTSGDDVHTATPVFLAPDLVQTQDKESATEIEITNDELLTLLTDSAVVVHADDQLAVNNGTGDAGDEALGLALLDVKTEQNIHERNVIEVSQKDDIDEDDLSQEEENDEKGKLYDELPITHNIQFSIRGDGRYQCPYCDTSFRKFCEARLHGVKHTDQRPFICRLCNQSFKFKAVLLRHIKLHSGNRPHVCSICGKGFLRQWDMKNHERTHDKTKPYNCPHCMRSFANQAYRIAHIRVVHKSLRSAGQGRHVCPECSRTFGTLRGLNNHKNVHKNKGSAIPPSDRKTLVQCRMCGADFVNKFALTRHVNRGACEKNMGPKKYSEFKLVEGVQQCSNCSQTFEDFEFLRDHLLSSECMEQMENPPAYFRNGLLFVCFKCCVTFETFMQFRQHKLSKACDLILNDDQSNVEDVMETEDGIKYVKEGHKFLCAMCDELFVNMKSMRRHIKFGACEKRVKKKEMLGELICSQCGGSFKGAFELKAHKESGECEPAKEGDISRCEQCDMVFTNVKALDRHLLTTKCGNPDLQKALPHASCRDCGASFCNPTTLKRHKQRGACEKMRKKPLRAYDSPTIAALTPRYRHPCSGCGNRFASREILRVHKKRGACEKMQQRKSLAGDLSSVSAKSAEGEDTTEDYNTTMEFGSEAMDDSVDTLETSSMNTSIVKAEADLMDIKREPEEDDYTGKDADGVVEEGEESDRFLCMVCRVDFTCASSLKRHWSRGACKRNVEAQEAEKTPCEGCGQSFPTVRAMRDHRVAERCREEEAEERNHCIGCYTTFATPLAFSLHQKEAKCWDVPLGTYKVCRDCGVCLANTSSLERHQSRGSCARNLATGVCADDGKKVRCEDCGNLYASQDSYYHHKKGKHCKGKRTAVTSADDTEQTSALEMSCEEADESEPEEKSNNKSQLDPATGELRQIRRKTITVMPSKSQLKRITKSDVEKSVAEDGRVACSVCGATFSTAKSLKRHRDRGACDKNVKKLHLLDETYCEGCGERFDGTVALREHKQRGECAGKTTTTEDEEDDGNNDATADGLIYCEYCNVGFVSLEALQIHQSDGNCKDKESESSSQEGTKKRSVWCSDCGASFTNKMSLKRHKVKGACDKNLGIKLEVVKPLLMCEGCGNEFKTKEILRKHQARGACKKIQEKLLSKEEQQ